MLKIKCGVCGSYLIENGENESDNEDEIIVNLSCPKCNTMVYYVINKETLNKDLNIDCQ